MLRQAIERLLPQVFQRALAPAGGDPLGALLSVMEELHAPSEEVLANLDSYFDPRRSQIDAFVPYLAGWVDLDYLFLSPGEEYSPTSASPLKTGLGRLRELVARGAWISQWRGTRQGLGYFLETVTGVTGFQIDEGRRPFHLVITVPVEAWTYRPLIDRVMAVEKPAYVTYELQRAADGGE